jgi:hypothetical protein
MARKLKTYQTSLGFFELAVAAPSMKAALEAWGADSNLFHQGAAKESEDPNVVAATMAAPGVVLKRPVGSSGAFKEHAELPSDLASGTSRKPSHKSASRKPHKHPPRTDDRAADRKAALAFEKEQKRRDGERRREEAARQRDRDRREKAAAKARAALDKAEREHAKKAADIQAEVEALEKRSRAEDDRWEKERERLHAALRRAGN